MFQLFLNQFGIHSSLGVAAVAQQNATPNVNAFFDGEGGEGTPPQSPWKTALSFGRGAIFGLPEPGGPTEK